ncbi:helix-turn-helix transcriptional regulator [Flavobacterium sp. ALJ2]|uniref:helix-turn-helix transcriptional regulator n=1 Tax=Flavobacterium sp. ALJ2 TaxID=2786960 RepID=UPI0018A081D7|nr:helix-turn-helix transcriptional regulator [Flavobacterium sp. ALJ2]MBF7093486.1 helix-turn-helix transcriptional regulator [Flavobacterium sp. ALJ2]
MRKITHSYGPGLNWIEVVAQAMGGNIDGNFVRGNNELYNGMHFILPLENNISAMLVDVTYKEKTLIEYRNTVDNFVGVHFYIMNNNLNFVLENESILLGKQDFNLMVVDSILDMDYIVEKGTSVYVVCIFIDKISLKEYMDENPKFKSISKEIFDSEKNTIVSMDRMNIDSLILINDFRKMPIDSPLFEIYFRGLVYKLMGNYLEQLFTKKVVISKVMGDDVKGVIASKALLLESIDEVFPGVDFLAEQVGMSPSKYKKLFTKISGLSPGVFFYSNKLQRAKELLESGKYTVGEVADKLNYANVSYLAKRFNSKYGIFPKVYQSLL